MRHSVVKPAPTLCAVSLCSWKRAPSASPRQLVLLTSEAQPAAGRPLVQRCRLGPLGVRTTPPERRVQGAACPAGGSRARRLPALRRCESASALSPPWGAGAAPGPLEAEGEASPAQPRPRPSASRFCNVHLRFPFSHPPPTTLSAFESHVAPPSPMWPSGLRVTDVPRYGQLSRETCKELIHNFCVGYTLKLTVDRLG